MERGPHGDGTLSHQAPNSWSLAVVNTATASRCSKMWSVSSADPNGAEVMRAEGLEPPRAKPTGT
jgi:hypothetical protein